MKLWLSIFAASLIARSAAQTPNGFNVTVSAPLEVVVQPSNINLTPSLLVSQAGKRSFWEFGSQPAEVV